MPNKEVALGMCVLKPWGEWLAVAQDLQKEICKRKSAA